MSGNYVLDTNIVIALFDQELLVKERLADADEILVPAIVIGELFHGAFRSRRASSNAKRVETFAESHTVIPIDVEIAQSYGLIKTQLRAKGTPVPDNDIWVAAVAQRAAATLATRDDHFRLVEGLKIESWES